MRAEKQYLIEMSILKWVQSINNYQAKTLYFSTGGWNSNHLIPYLTGYTLLEQYYEPRISQPGNLELNMFQPGKTSGPSQIGYGEVRLINSDGALDYLLDAAIDGREIVFLEVSADNILPIILHRCIMEQAECTEDEVIIRIKDPQAIFNVPVQSERYAGTNVLPDGIEGTSDIKGKLKPLTFGKVWNVSPVCVNTSKLIYQVHTGTVSIPKVYDKGEELTLGADYVSYADMINNAPAVGAYRVWPSGGCFRLGSKSVGLITADVVEGADANYWRPPNIGKRIALRVVAPEKISESDVTTLAAFCTGDDYQAGIYINEEMTVLTALDLILGSVQAWFGIDVNNMFRMARFEAPSGTPAVTLTVNECKSVNRIASNDASRGIVPWKVNIRSERNYTVQTSDLAGAVSQSRTTWLANEYRIYSVENIGTKVNHPMSKELNIDTLLIGTITIEHQRLLNLYGVRRDTLEVETTTDIVPYIERGKVVKLVYPRYGYDEGKLFRVIGISIDRALKQTRLRLWG